MNAMEFLGCIVNYPVVIVDLRSPLFLPPVLVWETMVPWMLLLLDMRPRSDGCANGLILLSSTALVAFLKSCCSRKKAARTKIA